jgi:hypothetical protein
LNVGAFLGKWNDTAVGTYIEPIDISTPQFFGERTITNANSDDFLFKFKKEYEDIKNK